MVSESAPGAQESDAGNRNSCGVARKSSTGHAAPIDAAAWSATSSSSR